MKQSHLFASWIFLLITVVGGKQLLLAEKLFFSSGTHRLKGHIATPDGIGPFPVVIFLHGGKGPMIGGDPAAIVEAIAQSGRVGFAPIRRNDPSMATHVQDVISAIHYVKSQKNVDAEQLALVGFSRGALLAFMASTRRRDLKAVVLMAPAHGRGLLHQFLADAPQVMAPTLVLVSKNDTKQANHVRISQTINATLKKAGKKSRLILYPPHGLDGHRLFFQFRETYWRDVENFLKSHLVG